MDHESSAPNAAERARGPIPPEIEAAIKEIAARPDRAEAAAALAAIANRAAASLHQVARAGANARKGQSDWGRWAGLVNASRDAVLRTATCRQTANQLMASEAGAGDANQEAKE